MSPILLADRWTGKKGSLIHLVSAIQSGVYRQNRDELIWAGLLPLVSLDGVAGEMAPILNAKGDSLRRRWEGNFAGASAPLVLNVLLDHLQRCSAARARKVRA